jgi:hypothetical protein
LKPWSHVLTTNTGIITLDNFSPALNCLSSDGIKPVLKNLFWNFNVTEYEATCDSVKLYVLGGGLLSGQNLIQDKNFLLG